MENGAALKIKGMRKPRRKQDGSATVAGAIGDEMKGQEDENEILTAEEEEDDDMELEEEEEEAEEQEEEDIAEQEKANVDGVEAKSGDLALMPASAVVPADSAARKSRNVAAKKRQKV